MMFLKNNGFTDEEIDAILNKYDSDTIDTLLLNQDNVDEVITYLKDYGIKDIPRLMLERIDIFYFPVSSIKKLFSQYEKDSVINALDHNSAIFDEML